MLLNVYLVCRGLLVQLLVGGLNLTGLKPGLPIFKDPPKLVFTALHGMQTRSSDENSVCLSVCPSHAWIVTKR